MFSRRVPLRTVVAPVACVSLFRNESASSKSGWVSSILSDDARRNDRSLDIGTSSVLSPGAGPAARMTCFASGGKSAEVGTNTLLWMSLLILRRLLQAVFGAQAPCTCDGHGR